MLSYYITPETIDKVKEQIDVISESGVFDAHFLKYCPFQKVFIILANLPHSLFRRN